MAAPTLQAEGTLNVVTTGDNTPTIPTHQADDILILVGAIWAPNSGSDVPAFSTPANWTKLHDVPNLTSPIDGRSAVFWRRATGSGTTVTLARPSGADTGNDTSFAACVYVIRGANTSDPPWDDLERVPSGAIWGTVANPTLIALTVSGTERLGIWFGVTIGGQALFTAATGWTLGTSQQSSTGTDAAARTIRQDNISANTPATTVTHVGPSPGGYLLTGITFKPTGEVHSGSGSLSTSVTLSATPGPATKTGAGTFSGTATLTPTPGAATKKGAGSLSTTATLSRTGQKQASSTGSISVSATLSATGQRGAETHSGAGTLALSLTFARSGQKIGKAAGTQTSSASFSTTGSKRVAGTGSLALSATFTRTGQKRVASTATLPLTATLALTSGKRAAGSGALALSTTLSRTAQKVGKSTATLPLSITLSAAGNKQGVETHSGAGALTLVLSLTTTTQKRASSTASLPLSFSTSTTGSKRTSGTAALPLVALLSLSTRSTRAGPGNLTATITLSRTGRKRGVAAGSITLSTTETQAGLKQGRSTALLLLVTTFSATGVKAGPGVRLPEWIVPTATLRDTLAAGAVAIRQPNGRGISLQATDQGAGSIVSTNRAGPATVR